MRKDWKVQLLPGDVVSAATKQLQFAERKVAEWTQEQNDKEQALRERGLTFSAPNSVSNTSYNQQQILADPQLMQGFTNAQRKVEEWTAKAEDFGQWLRLLELWTDKFVTLDKDDIAFFRL